MGTGYLRRTPSLPMFSNRSKVRTVAEKACSVSKISLGCWLGRESVPKAVRIHLTGPIGGDVEFNFAKFISHSS